MKCPKCGNENPDHLFFCGMCGQELPRDMQRPDAETAERVTAAADESLARPGRSRKSRIAKSAFVMGLLLAMIGASGVLSVSFPESGTALMSTDQTFVKLDGRFFGHVSGSFSSARDAGIGFALFDQHDLDIERTDSILTSYSEHGEQTNFSASLPASEAYYLYFFYITPLPNQTSLNGYGPVVVELHWDIWGPSVDYGGEFTTVLLLGIVFYLFGDYNGMKLRIAGKGERI